MRSNPVPFSRSVLCREIHARRSLRCSASIIAPLLRPLDTKKHDRGSAPRQKREQSACGGQTKVTGSSLGTEAGDAFFHVSWLNRQRVFRLSEGQRVVMDVVERRNGPKATNIRLILPASQLE